MEPFIETRSGQRFEPLEPRVEAIHIADIAHALANQCRFSGHTRKHYSVAEHSVRVSQLVQAWGESRDVQRWALLHDASEAYLVDLPAPLKRQPEFASYRATEARVMAAVCERFKLPAEEPEAVRRADGVLLATEARDLMPFRPEHWSKLAHSPLTARIEPWSHDYAKARFLLRFEELMP